MRCLLKILSLLLPLAPTCTSTHALAKKKKKKRKNAKIVVNNSLEYAVQLTLSLRAVLDSASRQLSATSAFIPSCQQDTSILSPSSTDYGQSVSCHIITLLHYPSESWKLHTYTLGMCLFPPLTVEHPSTDRTGVLIDLIEERGTTTFEHGYQEQVSITVCGQVWWRQLRRARR